MEGVTTKISKSNINEKQTKSNWVLSMLLNPRSTLLPDVTLCSKNGKTILMKVLDPTPTDDIISYQVNKIVLINKF